MSDRKPKMCPVFQTECLQDKCEYWNNVLKRCANALMPYNLYVFGQAVNNLDIVADKLKDIIQKTYNLQRGL